ncbi:predicted protein [Chaetomium globosum CBS 148.51]|uniref:Bacteriophage T5 Orf172 DNA-binding domain-containing protein n=1 Tax=Chaetomium globosum (strain ATCC 6205 / CBS 148.51 / DSM 1962 / NBRC 6347 / NRRL 1970) TaxID=306901 RepID=Q2H4M2_CHAGB|nr:uncharacterized protein CHGG_06393 [Chaetomium globosum CBS 148.51]EAQ89774.1 predicted protein [Chaetomium globosum CBS 148.51]
MPTFLKGCVAFVAVAASSLSLWNFVCHCIQRRGLWPSGASTPDPPDLHASPIPVNEHPTTVDNAPGPPFSTNYTPPLTAESPKHTNRKIANLLQNAAGLITPTTTTPAKSGFIYILTATHNNNNNTNNSSTPLIKIGRTTQPIPTRLAAMQRSCPNLHLEILPLTPPPSTTTTTTTTTSRSSHPLSTIPLHLAEKLAHAELAAARYVFRCPDCGCRHREFFAVEAGVGRRVVERWVRFCGGVPMPWEQQHTGSGAVGVELAAPWRERLEGFEGRGVVGCPVPVSPYLLWVEVALRLAVDGALWCRSVSLAALGWVMLGLVVAVHCIDERCAWPMGSIYTWATLSQGPVVAVCGGRVDELCGRKSLYGLGTMGVDADVDASRRSYVHGSSAHGISMRDG